MAYSASHKYKAALVFFVAIVLFPLCAFTDMTIWFQDGTSRQVRKIVFRDEVADLYLIDGRVMNVRVQQLDLKSSGIESPVGTYGETRLTPGTSIGTPGTATVSPRGLRQAELREQWDKSDKVATAEKSIGFIRQGQTVKIIRQPGSKVLPQYPADDDEEQTFIPADDAYVIIYAMPDGNLAKKVFDASTFAANFKIVQSRSEPQGPSIVPPPPEPAQVPREEITPDTTPLTNQPEELKSDSTEEEKVAPIVRSRPRRLIHNQQRRFPILIAAFIGGAVIVFLAMLLLKKKQPPVFINSSRFRQYEEELREFELELWMKHGKTPEQLTEICVKKYYQDSPEALNVALKMLKNPDRNAILPLIAKHAPKGGTQAESLYQEIKGRIEWIRQLIREVQAKRAQTATPAPPKPQPPVVAQPKEMPIQTKFLSPDELSDPQISTSSLQLPSYVANILSQLSLLTRQEDFDQ